jgi:hypothetical protein
MSTEVNFYTASAALAGKEYLDVASMKVVYQLEVSGEVFYNLLADRVNNAEAAELLRKNAVEERGHARRLARAISLKLGSEWEATAAEEEVLSIPLPDVVPPTSLLELCKVKSMAMLGINIGPTMSPMKK